jgi:hypothetical protein
MTNTMVPFALGTFANALTPKLTVFVASLKPVPIMVVLVPTGPVRGCTAVIAGAADGATLLVVHADRRMTPRHTPKRAGGWTAR